MDSLIYKGKWTRVWMFLTVGITLIVSTGILTFSKDRIFFLFSSESFPYFPENHLQIFLMLATLFLVYQWIRIHIGEIQLLNDSIEEFLPSLPRPSFAIIVSFAIILGMLSYFSYDIVIYSSIFVVFSIFDIWSIYYRSLTIKKALENAKTANKGENRIKIFEVIEVYYLEKPHMQRSATVMFFSFTSLILGVVAQLYPNPKYVKLFISLAYGIMSFNIILSEIIINHWRRERDIILGENYS